MRLLPVVLLALTLTACDFADSKPKTDANAPLTSREQALIYGADGAAQQGNFAAAERDYQAAIALSTGRVDAHLALARLYGKQQMAEKEHEMLKAVLKLQPNHPLANYLMGKAYLDDNRYDDALLAFKNGRNTRPDDIDLSTGEAIASDMLGKHRDAQRVYGRIMQQNPNANLANIRANLAMSYLLTGDAKKAVALLKDDVKKPDASPVARHNLALAYGLLGRNTEAKDVLNGDIDEETRQLALARLKEYLQDRDNDINTPPLRPVITPAAGEIEDSTVPPVAKPEVKPAKPKPSAKPAVAPAVVPPATL